MMIMVWLFGRMLAQVCSWIVADPKCKWRQGTIKQSIESVFGATADDTTNMFPSRCDSARRGGIDRPFHSLDGTTMPLSRDLNEPIGNSTARGQSGSRW